MQVRDVLDAVTIFGLLVHPPKDHMWIAFCQRAMREEGMKYEVRDDGSVAYFIAPEFQGAADDAVAALNGVKFAGASAGIANAVRELNRLDGSPKAAIRETYTAVETAFKVALTTNATLGEREIAATLGPAVDRLFSSADPVARGAAAGVMQSMKDWVNAVHKYRHGHDHPEPVELGVEVLRSPVASPKANAICERVIGTARRECLDWLIPMSEAHLRAILKCWVTHYNGGRPHSALGPGVPDPPENDAVVAKLATRHRLAAGALVLVKSILGGLHHEYSLAAAPVSA